MKPVQHIRSFLIVFCTLILSALIASICIEKQWLPAFSFLPKQEHFESYAGKLIEEELADDPLSTHFLYRQPPFTLDQSHASLPLYQGVTDDSLALSFKSRLKALDATCTSPNSMDDFEKELLQIYLTQNYKLATFPYYSEPLSPNGGLQTELPLLLNAFLIQNKQDINTYLSLLSSFDEWASSVLDYETGKKEAGLFMPYHLALETADQCIFFARDPSFLVDSFVMRLQTLLTQGILSDAEFEKAIAIQKKIVDQVFVKAYENLADGLLHLADPSVPMEGLVHLPQGKAYYEALLTSLSGSSKTPAEMEQLLATRYARVNADFTKSLAAFMSDMKKNPQFRFSFPILNGNEMLQYLQEATSNHFPVLPLDTPIEQSILAVPDGLSAYTAPAFYICSPLDQLELQQIYINYAQTNDGLSLFTTLAHEGYPGHLYQHVYSTATGQKQHRTFVNSLYGTPGYQEGWAIYVEFWAYDLAREMVSSDMEKHYIEVVKLDRLMQLYLYAYLDIMIHYEGIGYEKASAILQNLGITDASTCQSIYSYIVSSPGNYVQYMMGYEELLECKQLARDLWGDGYSDDRFHACYLSAGNVPFEQLKNYIARQD